MSLILRKKPPHFLDLPRPGEAGGVDAVDSTTVLKASCARKERSSSTYWLLVTLAYCAKVCSRIGSAGTQNDLTRLLRAAYFPELLTRRQKGRDAADLSKTGEGSGIWMFTSVVGGQAGRTIGWGRAERST